ncbi:hypothetical protein SS1G_07094 [Sclerotinia sclerotiorum 1980 UF-70]|uniref:Uncharacterized protein n=1 Tax=Sclerotinia sclerotiorum (strain ATCC 18683 / 1980 / Ss-1) TaxID=665079 RepID=A7EP45_SCLS1|nr:hypothetical protein SS1G_07094 [Sclerotinia sclerotiorum 1980 UF-70]EDO04611.1 hypothetical protein SS1G_07094 [Sclerotinia sclerotiorum 1980 UF-70]
MGAGRQTKMVVETVFKKLYIIHITEVGNTEWK